ncbi:MAG TPA: PhoH family protein [Steroidobacteraceae bacterium]|nr:PhoH family protein [Steroidobacteraceae bacterium]
MSSAVPIEAREVSLEGADNQRLANFAGPMEQNLRHVEERLGVEVRRRGHQLQVLGPSEPVANAATVLQRMFEMSARETLSPDRVHLCVQEYGFPQQPAPGAESGGADGTTATAMTERDVVVQTQRGGIRGRGPNQRLYLDQIRVNDLTFGIGPAGTGKTYLAVASAVEALQSGSVRRIVLVRPAVEAGERLGFLPGDMAQKVDPYLRPMYDALYEMMGFDRVARNIERQVIEVAPLAFMRGRSLNDSFIILDEAQNTSVEQMKMFLTRLGFGSKAVVTGDITQVDLPRQQRSGLRHAIEVLRGVDGVAFTFFNARDVVRHPLVQRIVQAYERSTDPDDVQDR